VAITVQFIDEDWKLRNIPVAFVNVTGPHTAKAIGEIVADKLSYFLGTYFLLNKSHDKNQSFTIVFTYFEFMI
jgi:hypothetical protein